MALDAQGRVVPDAQAKGWRVTSQQETIELGPDGRTQNGWRVFFTTDQGATGSVFLPATRYTPDNVRAAVADLAHRLDSVQTMSG